MKNKEQFTKKFIPEEYYILNGEPEDVQYNVYSTLNILNKNNDLFKSTKNTIKTAIKSIFSVEEIKDLLEQTNSSSVEILAKKVQNAIDGKNNDVKINAVATSVTEFLTKVKAEEQARKNNVEYEGTPLKNPIEEYAPGPYNLVQQTTNVYGTNRYLDYNTQISQLSPLFVKFENESEGINKVAEVEKHLKAVYGYNVTYSRAKNPVHIFKRTLKLTRYEGKMDSCINMLYSVAQNLVGSKKVEMKLAKKVLGKDKNEFFNSRKYDNRAVKGIYAEQEETMKDIVSTFTTIFMARFVFEAPEFAEIERDLTEQACKKMQNLRFGMRLDEDYWVNQFIQDRLKVNVAQILTANNIVNANQLLEIYNKNGTRILNANNITNLEDLVFAPQFSGETYVKNKELKNLFNNNLNNVKSKIKNKEVKVRKPRSNRYLNNVIRPSEEYKKYYQEYLKIYQGYNFNVENEETLAELNKVQSDLNLCLNNLSKIAANSEGNKKLTDDVTKTTAKVDALKDAIDEKCATKTENVKESANETDYATKFSILDGKDAEMFNAADGQVAMKGVTNMATQEVENIENEVVEDVEETENVQISIDDLLASQQKQYSSQKKLSELSSEGAKKRIKKYYENIVFGKKGKVGIISKNLNYRLIEKSTKKNLTYASDNERLNDKDLNIANKIRDKKAGEMIENLTNVSAQYFEENKTELQNSTPAQVCAKSIKNHLKIEDDKTFTQSDLKKFMSILLANNANEELKEHNVELYTGKDTYKQSKKYNNEKELI